MILAHFATEYLSDSIVISGWSGSSYGELMPVNDGISPFLAFLYNPLGSRFSQTSSGHFTNTSMKSSSATSSLAVSRSFLNGEINAVSANCPLSIKSLAVSAMRRIFS